MDTHDARVCNVHLVTYNATSDRKPKLMSPPAIALTKRVFIPRNWQWSLIWKRSFIVFTWEKLAVFCDRVHVRISRTQRISAVDCCVDESDFAVSDSLFFISLLLSTYLSRFLLLFAFPLYFRLLSFTLSSFMNVAFLYSITVSSCLLSYPLFSCHYVNLFLSRPLERSLRFHLSFLVK